MRKVSCQEILRMENVPHVWSEAVFGVKMKGNSRFCRGSSQLLN